METLLPDSKLKFLTDGKGKKTGVLLSLRDFRRIEEQIENFEDTIDLLRAEREAVSFTPYEEFRKTWLLK